MSLDHSWGTSSPPYNSSNNYANSASFNTSNNQPYSPSYANSNGGNTSLPLEFLASVPPPGMNQLPQEHSTHFSNL
jgi:hypothetical protein